LAQRSPQLQSCAALVERSLCDDSAWVRQAALKAANHLLRYELKSSTAAPGHSLGTLVAGMVACGTDDSSEVRLKAVAVLKNASKADASVVEQYLPSVLPPVLDALSDRNGSVKVRTDWLLTLTRWGLINT